MDHQIAKENRRKTYESIIENIKEDILHGRLHIGQKLPPERLMAEKYNVSRPSIREALRTLENLGMIESVQGSGNYISSNFEKNMLESFSMLFMLQQIDTKQINELREALEIKAALLAVDKITDEDVNEMEDIVRKMSEDISEQERTLLDKKLHYTMARASENRLIIQFLDVLSELMSTHIQDRRNEILQEPGNGPKLQKIHESIVQGLKEHNHEETYEAIAAHFSLISDYLMENQ